MTDELVEAAKNEWFNPTKPLRDETEGERFKRIVKQAITAALQSAPVGVSSGGIEGVPYEAIVERLRGMTGMDFVGETSHLGASAIEALLKENRALAAGQCALTDEMVERVAKDLPEEFRKPVLNALAFVDDVAKTEYFGPYSYYRRYAFPGIVNAIMLLANAVSECRTLTAAPRSNTNHPLTTMRNPASQATQRSASATAAARSLASSRLATLREAVEKEATKDAEDFKQWVAERQPDYKAAATSAPTPAPTSGVDWRKVLLDDKPTEEMRHYAHTAYAASGDLMDACRAFVRAAPLTPSIGAEGWRVPKGALDYLADIRIAREKLMREGFHPQQLNDMEAGACGVLSAMGFNMVEIAEAAAAPAPPTAQEGE